MSDAVHHMCSAEFARACPVWAGRVSVCCRLGFRTRHEYFESAPDGRGLPTVTGWLLAACGQPSVKREGLVLNRVLLGDLWWLRLGCGFLLGHRFCLRLRLRRSWARLVILLRD